MSIGLKAHIRYGSKVLVGGRTNGSGSKDLYTHRPKVLDSSRSKDL